MMTIAYMYLRGLWWRGGALLGALVLTASAGCDSAPTDVARTSGSAWAAVASAAGPTRQLPEEKRKFGETTVYVDGTPMGVLKYSELPPTIRPEVVMRGPEPFPLFPVDQYLSGIGVDLSKVKAVHFHGGRRTARMAGSEVNRLSKLLTFAFTRTTEGNPYVVWPEVPFTVSTSVDMVKQVDVFVDKEPPTQDQKKRKWFYADGSEVVGVAYGSEGKNIKATRIYADGKLLAAIRRKGIPEGVLLPGTEADPVYGLDLMSEALGIKKETIKNVDLLVGDKSYVRLTPEAFQGSTFALPHKRQGKIDIKVDQGARTVEGVTAIQIYQAAPLFDRDEKYYEAKPGPR